MTTEDIVMKPTRRIVPKSELRGRPTKYNIHKIKIGTGMDISVEEKHVKNVRSKVCSSASHFGVRVKTQYDQNKGILTIWRIE